MAVPNDVELDDNNPSGLENNSPSQIFADSLSTCVECELVSNLPKIFANVEPFAESSVISVYIGVTNGVL